MSRNSTFLLKTSDYTKEGRKIKPLDSILLNGNHIAMVYYLYN